MYVGFAGQITARVGIPVFEYWQTDENIVTTLYQTRYLDYSIMGIGDWKGGSELQHSTKRHNCIEVGI